ncbi:MAG: hypothetical protein ACD_2C00052G0011 [uncultured bacterium (gcode 4)]|uniref:Imm-5-like domain-containing protein n=1 Tax=uncultured bacterium (gcode 4) TaxID=1234023 RepID=K2H2F3_9BACT|nr:MAG: hypothetical protein ACD_2C00052G0011 [uncultured bacterium (gcode 4)]
MRNPLFIAEHRGWPLTKERHIELIRWSCECVRHVLPLLGDNIDPRIVFALETGEKWASGIAIVGDARKAAMWVIIAARESQNPTEIAIFRAAWHAVATAHMADHAPGWAEYALKAIIYEWKSFDEERKWQDEKLPEDIREMVITSRSLKGKAWMTSFKKAQKEWENFIKKKSQINN